MAHKQILAPNVPALTLAQIKSHLRITGDTEDELLEGLTKSAIELLETETAMALISQGWRLWLDDLPASGVVELPRNPVQRITNVVWYDAVGTPHSVAGNAYFLNSMTRPARLRFNPSALPSGACNGIEIDFDAGFGDLGIDVPDLLLRALLALIAHWYEFRGVVAPDDQPVSVPDIYTRLTRHYRQVRL